MASKPRIPSISEIPKDEPFKADSSNGDGGYKITITRTRTIERTYSGADPAPLETQYLMPNDVSFKVTLPSTKQHDLGRSLNRGHADITSRSKTSAHRLQHEKDGNLDDLADELLENLGLADYEGRSSQQKSEHTIHSAEQIQPNVENQSQCAYHRPSAASTRNGKPTVPQRPGILKKTSTSSDAKRISEPIAQKPYKRLSTKGSSPSNSVLIGESFSRESASSKTLYSPVEEQQNGGAPIGTQVHHPSLDVIYADIIDHTNYKPCLRALRPLGNSRFVRLLRHIKEFGNLRLATEIPTVKFTDHEEPLGVLLAPPSGSSHFEVQLTICGLLRRNAACAYELYHFFLQNGFFNHLNSPPHFKSWSEDFQKAISDENSFYREGIRVSFTGEMDYLRDVYEEWIEAWLDWRLARPIPK